MKREERTENIVVRVSRRDKQAFEKAAGELEMNLSEFMRAAALTYLVATLKPHGWKMLGKGTVLRIGDMMEKLREPFLRKIVSGGKQGRSG